MFFDYRMDLFVEGLAQTFQAERDKKISEKRVHILKYIRFEKK